MVKLRKTVFLIFIGIYLIIAPFTVLYALGYIFSPVQQRLFQTGLISLNSEPSRAHVWLNELPLKNRTPLILRNLKPGEYHLRLALPGHHGWERRVQVHPDVALRLENVFLFPIQLEWEVLGRSPISRLWYAAEGRQLVVLQGNKASGLHLFDMEQKKFRTLFFRSPYQDLKVEEVYLHPAGDRAVAVLQKENVRLPLFLRFTDPIKVRNLTDFLQEPFRQIEWSSDQKNWLFYLKGNTLMRLDLEHNVLYPAVARQVRGFTLKDHRLFILDGKNRFLEMSEKGKLRETLLEDPLKARLIFGGSEEDFYSIYFLRNDTAPFLPNRPIALFVSQNGKLISNKLPYFLDEGLDDLIPASSHPRIVYRKGEELWGIDFERETQKTFFESGPAPRKIYKGKGALTNIFWFYQDQYLLFTEGARLAALEFEGEGNPVELLQISRRVREVFFDQKGGFLYFIHPENDQLVRTRLTAPEASIPQMVVDLVGAGKEK